MDSIEYKLEDLVLFQGKELNDVSSGKRTQHRQIRIGIGVNGVYKFESENDQLIKFWNYTDIDDWNYSGYSFTLSLKGKLEYHIRTDHGPSISYWIESFIKSPQDTVISARNFNSLGEDYSASNNATTKQPVFYTLNRKRSNRPHASDRQTRLLSAYGVDPKTTPTTAQSINVTKPSNNDLKRWSTGYKPAQVTSSESTNPTASNSIKAKSMDCISNGYDTTTHASCTINDRHGNNTTPTHNDDNEEGPVVPPRNTSLRTNKITPSNNETTPSNNETTPTNNLESSNVVSIKVSNADDSLPKSSVYEEIEISLPLNTSDYDHLFPSNNKGHKPAIRRKKSNENGKEKEKENKEKEKENKAVATSIRRNESLPPMAFHSPVITKRDPPTFEDEDSGGSDYDESVSPLPEETHNEGGVVMRKKSTDNVDPFADLLSAPPNKSRLRWSQELNPIYDNIKGVKISPKIVGYDSSLDSTIFEEDSSSLSRSVNTSTSTITEDNHSISSSSDRLSSSDSQFEGLVFIPQSAPNTLQRVKRIPHNYDEVVFGEGGMRPRTNSGRPLSEHYNQNNVTEQQQPDVNPSTASNVRRLRSTDTPVAASSPQINKRLIQHRRSKTVRAVIDDSNAPLGRQRAQHVSDTMRDFSYITRDYRVFYIKMPNGHLVSQVVNINRPVNILIDKLAEMLGSGTTDSYSLFVEGSILTTMKEASLEFGELLPAKPNVNASSVSLAQLVDNNSLADQGDSPILLKGNLTFRVQGISTARILRLDDSDDIVMTEYTDHVKKSVKDEFHEAWLSVVQGNQPTSLDSAVKLAALQYQAYFLERTAENSVVGFCRPTEFLPAEFVGARGIEGKIYKEQEKIKCKSHSQIHQKYLDYCRSLSTSGTLFFPVREARRRLLQSAKLKPVLLGVNKRGVMRVCPKSKEVLEFWEYQVLKNWAYFRRTFVIAFSNKNYPVETNQAKWISDLVDFHVHSIVQSTTTPPRFVR